MSVGREEGSEGSRVPGSKGRKEAEEGSEGARVGGSEGRKEGIRGRREERRKINTEKTEGGRRYTEKSDQELEGFGEGGEEVRLADQAEEGGGFGLFLLLGELTHLADPSINVHG